MRERFYLIIGLFFIAQILGCGGSTVAPFQSVGADVIQKNALSVISQLSTTSITVPQQFADDWSVKENLCQQIGYDLIPYAGQQLSLTQFDISEKYYIDVTTQQHDANGVTTTTVGLPLYLWVISKDNATIGAYVTLTDDPVSLQYIHLGVVNSTMFAVNDANIR
jgi:hypothetical protein